MLQSREGHKVTILAFIALSGNFAMPYGMGVVSARASVLAHHPQLCRVTIRSSSTCKMMRALIDKGTTRHQVQTISGTTLMAVSVSEVPKETLESKIAHSIGQDAAITCL